MLLLAGAVLMPMPTRHARPGRRNPLHHALLRLESGLAMAEIANPVPRTGSIVFAAAIRACTYKPAMSG